MTSLACWWVLLMLVGCASAGEPGLTDAKAGDGPEEDIVAVDDSTGAPTDVAVGQDVAEPPVLADAGAEDDGEAEPQTADVEVPPVQGDGGATVDAGPSTDEPDAPAPIPCEEDNPAGCVQTGCPEDQVCSVDEGCAPSACLCTDVGEWMCTQDCAGGVCVAKDDTPDVGTTKCDTPNPGSCSVVDCPAGMACDEEAGCAPSSCECTALGIWSCTADCVPGICVEKVIAPDPGGAAGCKQPSPASCIFVGCKGGYTCDEDAPGCAPSECTCTESPQGPTWLCTEDCHPGQCVPAIPTPGLICPKPGPATCVDNGCPGTMVCDEEAGCGPSECNCDLATGEWICTDDCVPGICVPKSDGPVIPEDCPEGEVPTSKGCQTCEEVLDHVIAMMPFVEGGADKCLEDSECVLSDGGTACMGTCPISVNGAMEEIYLAKKQDLSDDFCAGYALECGYMTPSCLPAEPQCIDGICEAVPSTQ